LRRRRRRREAPPRNQIAAPIDGGREIDQTDRGAYDEGCGRRRDGMAREGARGVGGRRFAVERVGLAREIEGAVAGADHQGEAGPGLGDHEAGRDKNPERDRQQSQDG